MAALWRTWLILNHAEGYPRDLTAIQREGLDWVALLVSGRATLNDRVSLERWRAQSSAHAEAFSAAVKLVRLARTRKFPGSEQFRPALWERPMTRRMALGGAIAAATSVAIIRPPLELWPSLAELTSDYRTGVGERREVALATGLSLELNTRTSVALKSHRGQPGIALIAGEVAANVRLPAAQRFYVIAGGSRISANDASFDLRMSDDGVCVTCARGMVHIGDDLVALGPRQQLTFTRSGFGKPVIVDPSVVTAWRNGELIFYNASLGHIVTEINRYRSGKIVILNSELASRQFNSTFRIDHIENVVADLQKLANVSATTLPGGIVLLS